MNILHEITELISNMDIPVKTDISSDIIADEYVIIMPLLNTSGLFDSNLPKYETQEARLSLYSKKTYLVIKKDIILKLVSDEFTITDRQYINYENNNGYHHYAIDVAKIYPKEDLL